MMRLWRTLVVCALLAGAIGGIGRSIARSHAQTQTSYDNLEIVFALDISGSMWQDDVRQSADQLPPNDVGYALLPLRSSATDRAGERFDITRNNIQWLARQLQSRPDLSTNLQVHTAVIGFDQDARTLLDWTVLNGIELSNVPDLRQPAPPSGEAHNSDFINLYAAVDTLFAEANTSGTTRRVLVVVTDSLPCKQVNTYSEQRIGELQVYNYDCQSPEVMTNHIRYAHTDTGAWRSGAIPFMLHISPSSIWNIENRGASLQATRATWENTTRERNGAFIQLTSINDLPQQMFDVLAEQLTLAIAGGNQASDAQIGSTLGLVASTGSFEVPPYQEYLEMLVLSQSATLPTITANGARQDIDATIFASQSGTMRYLRFDRPSAGSWTVQDPGGEAVTMRVMYRPAESRLVWESANPAAHLQYQPVRLVYTIQDKDDVSWIDLDYEPQFTVSVQPPLGDPIPLAMNCDTSRCVSEEFLPLHEGAYSVTFDVVPEDSWPEITIATVLAAEGEDQGEAGDAGENADANGDGEPQVLTLADQYAFLKPEMPDDLQVNTLTLWRQVGDNPPASSVQPDSSVQVNQARSGSLGVRVWVGDEDEPANLPPGLTANLVYDEGAGCLPEAERITQLRQEGQYLLARPELRFETGDCSVAMTLVMASDLKPIGTGGSFPMGSFKLADVSSSFTSRLSLALLDEDGQPLDILPSSSLDTASKSGDPHYKMFDYDSVPQFNSTDLVTWDRPIRSIEIAFLDENRRLTHPRFLGEANATTSDGSAAPVPFRFSIVRTDGTGNFAAELGLEPVRSEKEGVYVVEVSGLDAGDYFVQFELLLDDPHVPQLDTSLFEYDSSLTGQTGNPLLVAHLRVNTNLVRWGEIVLAAVVAAILLIVIVITSIASRRRSVAPLSGTLALYRLSRFGMSGDDQPEQLLKVKLPTNRNTYQVPRRLLFSSPDLIAALFNGITVTTGRNRQISRLGGASVAITIGSQVYSHHLTPGEPQFVYTDEQGAKFYAVKFVDEVEALPGHKFADS